MFAVLPISAAVPTESALRSLADSATSVADALTPFLEAPSLQSEPKQQPYTIQKVVSCDIAYSALLRSDGKLLLLSQLTENGPLDTSSVSVLESGGEEVVDVAAGAAHIVYCTTSGAVYSCGYDNTYGQLGDGSVWSCESHSKSSGRGNAAVPPPLSEPKRIAEFGVSSSDCCNDSEEASCGSTIATMKNTTDCREAIGLALPPSSLANSSPTTKSTADSTQVMTPNAKRHVPPRADHRVAQVSCGARHTLLLTQSSRCVYACGTGEHGQLGGSRLTLMQPTFRAIPLLFGLDMAQIAAAGSHSFVLLRNGLLYAFGDNTCGQLGLGHTRRVDRPTLVPLRGEAEAGADPNTSSLPSASAKARRLLDAKAYSSLRAPYASTGSASYPLRVPRLQTEYEADGSPTEGGERVVDSAAKSLRDDWKSNFKVVRVYCCACWTLLETTHTQLWLSCGIVLTRGVASSSVVAAGARIDGCTVLGRPLIANKSEAYSFQPVQWTAELSEMQSGVVATSSAFPATPGWIGGAPSTFGTALFGSGEGRENEMPELPLAPAPPCCDSFTAAPEGSSSLGSVNATTAPVADDFPGNSHISQTLPSLMQATKATAKVLSQVGGAVVKVYPTSLLVALPDLTAASLNMGRVNTRIIVQSGSPAPVAMEMFSQKSSCMHVVTASNADAPANELSPAGSRGTSILKVTSSRGIVIPLPTYVLIV